ncbi:MAG: hypothetical protein O3B41_11115 [Bacteroidetes bacterium]|nr:hypothetical protein [Bacteroidota bacterium]
MNCRLFQIWLIGMAVGCLFGGLWAAPVLAQNSVEAGFTRDINRYLWTSEASLKFSVGTWRLDLQNKFRSDAFLLFNDKLSFRNEDQLRYRGQRTVPGRTTNLVVSGRAEWFSLSRVFRQDNWIGFRFQGPNAFWVEPVVGISIDSRPGFGENVASAPIRTDIGPGFGLQFGIPLTNLSGYLVEGAGQAQFEQTAPRVGQLMRVAMSGRRMFENTSIRSLVRAATVRRDAYQAASFLNRDDVAGRMSETVESTRSDTINVFLEVDSKIASPVWITGGVDISTNSRSVETLRAPSDALFFDSNFNRRTVEATLAARYEKGDTRLRIAAVAGAEVERRRLDNADDLPTVQAAQKLSLLRQADNERGYFSIQQSTKTTLKPWWQFQFDGSAHILRHDTPEVNPDDRDELQFNAQIGSRFRVREDLHLSVQILGSRFHTVYIKSDRSAENNVQRSLRYRPSVEWQAGRNTKVKIGSEVRATYTVDDFLLPGRRPTDQAAREMRHEVEIEHATNAGTRFFLNTSYSDLRLGRFLDKVFAEIPFDTLRTYSGWARIQSRGKIQAELGLRFFIRTDFDRSASVRYRLPTTGGETSITRMGRTRIDQIGPTTAISWYLKPDALFRIEGWAMVQKISHTLYGALPEGLGPTIQKAARKGRKSVIPNLSVSIRWTW